jgi:hypothetical protein
MKVKIDFSVPLEDKEQPHYHKISRLGDQHTLREWRIGKQAVRNISRSEVWRRRNRIKWRGQGVASWADDIETTDSKKNIDRRMEWVASRRE